MGTGTCTIYTVKTVPSITIKLLNHRKNVAFYVLTTVLATSALNEH